MAFYCLGKPEDWDGWMDGWMDWGWQLWYGRGSEKTRCISGEYFKALSSSYLALLIGAATTGNKFRMTLGLVSCTRYFSAK
jgi:hypothetical protein